MRATWTLAALGIALLAGCGSSSPSTPSLQPTTGHVDSGSAKDESLAASVATLAKAVRRSAGDCARRRFSTRP